MDILEFIDKHFKYLKNKKINHYTGIHISKKKNIKDYLNFINDDSFVEDFNKLKYKSNQLYAINLIVFKKILGIESAQIFLSGPKNYKSNDIDCELLKEVSKRLLIKLVGHGTYLAILPNAKNLKYIIKENINLAKQIGITDVIFHIRHTPSEDPYEASLLLSKELKKIEKYIPNKMHICLEPMGYYDGLFLNPNELNILTTTMETQGLSNNKFKICLDTSHIFMGTEPISKYHEADDFIYRLKNKQWYKSVGHYQGNKTNINKDIHCIPFSEEDKLWKGTYYLSGLRRFIEWNISKRCPIIFEIDFIYDEKCYKSLKKLFNSIRYYHG